MKPYNQIENTDFLIIGSGIAGLTAALELSKQGRKIALVTKSKLEDSNTYFAQGGIAAVDPDRVKAHQDSFDLHAEDTLRAGDGLCLSHIVNNFARNAYSTIEFLIEAGVLFSKSDKKEYPFILHQEGGHSAPRIYCVADYTGKAIEETLAEKVRKDKNITLLENHAAIDLITRNKFSEIKSPFDRCLGAYILDKETGNIRAFEASATFLATGGVGRAFMYTTNPENATGDGIAMAYRAGARIANMEFFQFHPTVLYEPNPKNPAERRFLLTEALRGEEMGAILTLEEDSKEDFVLKYDPRGSHATRDIVAKAIDAEIKKGKDKKHVWLNTTPEITGKSPEYIRRNYPNIYEHLIKKGIDMIKHPIPVIPAAHYTCGGIAVNEFGLTDIEGLYAIGEVSCTGLMGANRLASNSLSEGALYGKLAVMHALRNYKRNQEGIPKWKAGSVDTKIDQATLNQFWDTTRTTMMNLCGIERNGQRLEAASHILEGLVKAANNIYWDFYPTHDILELMNLTQVSEIIAISALHRKESRGGHFRSDYPDKDDKNYKAFTIISRDRGIFLKK